MFIRNIIILYQVFVLSCVKQFLLQLEFVEIHTTTWLEVREVCVFFCAALLLTLLPSMQDGIVLDSQRVFAGVAAIRWATPLFFAVLICLWCAGQSTDHDFERESDNALLSSQSRVYRGLVGRAAAWQF